jgi:hypothetical protein
MTVEPFSDVETFFFGTPLYAAFSLTKQNAQTIFRANFRVDGHCPHCRRLSTFTRSEGAMSDVAYARFVERLNYSGDMTFVCARGDEHRIKFNLFVREGNLLKVGQFPSFADIALDESKTYRGVLSDIDASELHKAIGLAAHGVGIGSFVYMRRIFERLIYRRFDEFKGSENWSEEEFKKLRMADKIDLLKDHLPEFLVANKKLYSIMSVGIHELDEKGCLSVFEVLRKSMVFILNEDKRKKEELALRNEVIKEIEKYEPPETVQFTTDVIANVQKE